MNIELPVLRLGLAGFSAQQQVAAEAVLEAALSQVAAWRLADIADADAWWVHGARTVPQPDGTLCINPGMPSERTLHFDVKDVDRPLAFVRPLPPPPFEAACDFDLGSQPQALAMLERFTAWMRPMLAEFGLASSIVDHQAVLGSGCFQVMQGTTLIAVVDMRGDVGVLPSVTSQDFEEAMWVRSADGASTRIPEGFARLSLSQLMWQFALRTGRDLLPAHYRTGLLYFRRPPRLSQRMMREGHFILLRQLAIGCATMEELQLRTGIDDVQLSRDLAALYFVGAITSSVKRAASGSTRRLDVSDSILSAPTSLPASAAGGGVRLPVDPELTVPARLRPR